MRRRALVPLLVVGSGFLAACVPVTPPPPPPPPPQPVSQYCAPSTPNSAATYKAAFDNLRKTYTEWATADGAVPVRLSGSRTLWLFSDTYIGSVSSTGVVEPGARIVSNSAVLQTGRCFKPVLGGGPLARAAWIADPAPGQAYWPVSAVLDASGDRLNVVLQHVVRHPNTWLVDVVGTRIARFRASTLQPLGVTGILPGTNALRPYGGTTFTEGGTAYLYSSNGGTFHLARAPIASMTSQSTWQYWTGPGDAWSAPGASNAAQPLEFNVTTAQVGSLAVGAPIAPLHVNRYGDGYLGTAMLIDGFTREVHAYTAPTPFGPWTEAGQIATTPSNVRSYGARTLFGLQGSTPPILGYSTNLLPEHTTTTFSRYGFRFVNVVLPPAPTAITEVPEATTTTAPTTTSPTTTPTSSSTTTTSSTTTSSTTTATTAPP